MKVLKSAVIHADNRYEFKYTIEQLEDNSIRLTPENTNAQLHLLADSCCYPIPADKCKQGRDNFDYFKYSDLEYETTEELCSKLIDFIYQHSPNDVTISETKRVAMFEGSVIEQTSDNKFTIIHHDIRKTLLMIAEYVYDSFLFSGFYDFDEQKLGSKIIDEMNRSDDEIWDWWVSLDKCLKFTFLYNSLHLEYFYEKDEYGILKVYYDEELQNDRNGQVEDYLLDYYQYIDTFYVTDAYNSKAKSIIRSEHDEDFFYPIFYDACLGQLAFLPYLEEVSFEGARGLGCLPLGLDKIKQLKRIRLDGAYIENSERNIEELFKIAKSIPTLEVLDLRYTELAYYLEENEEILKELQALMPNCNIKLEYNFNYDD